MGTMNSVFGSRVDWPGSLYQWSVSLEIRQVVLSTSDFVPQGEVLPWIFISLS